jgi:uncharacterized lipoprotein YmbA
MKIVAGHQFRVRLRDALPLAIAALLSACGSVPTQNYYVLTPTISGAASANATPSATGPVVFVDRAHLPELVDRPQFVIGDGQGSNRVSILEQQRWAEPLRAAIPQVIAVDLERQLPGARVSASPPDAWPPDAWRLMLDIQRFEARPGDAVTVEIAWTLARGEADKGALRTGRSTARQPVGAGDYAAIAAAASRALGSISADIAAALK